MAEKIKCFISNILITNSVDVLGLKIVEKVLKRFGILIFLPLLCIRFRARKTVFESSRKGVLKNFLKKVSKKFGGYKKTPYLCTTFALIKQPRAKIERESRKA